MKKLLTIFYVLLILFSTVAVNAQDFTVEIEQTDDVAHHIKPLKPGDSHQFQISVTNNLEETCTVSLNKNVMGELESWISIDDNSQSISKNQTVNFLLTINVPGNANDRDYILILQFNAYDGDGSNHSFNYWQQTIIVDKSPPSAPTFAIGQITSKTIFVNGWNSWDERSNIYTAWNSASGINGIKSFTVAIKNPDGSVKASISKDVTEYNYYDFKNLAPNTNYTASVTAIDLAGNSMTSEKAATTAPAPPTGLAFSNTTYSSTMLSWNTSPGATGYDVYEISGSTHTKLNSSPVTSNSYTKSNLSPNTSYTFYVKARSNAGISDKSSNATVTTLALPIITGPSIVCTSNTTYTLNNLPPNSTILWSKSDNLTQVGGNSGSSYTVIANGRGIGHIYVTFNGYPIEKEVKVNPLYEVGAIRGPRQLTPGLDALFSVNNNSDLSYTWSIPSGCYAHYCWDIVSGQGSSSLRVRAGSTGRKTITMTARNRCSLVSSQYKSIFVQNPYGGGNGDDDDWNGGDEDDPCLPYMRVSPNPGVGGDIIGTVIYPPDDPCDNVIMKQSINYDWRIYNKRGTEVYKKINSNLTSLNIGELNLRKGIYFIIVSNQSFIIKNKFIIR